MLKTKINEFVSNLNKLRTILLEERYLKYIINNEPKITKICHLNGVTLPPLTILAWILTGDDEKYLTVDAIGTIMEMYPFLKGVIDAVPIKYFADEQMQEIMDLIQNLILTPIEEIFPLLD